MINMRFQQIAALVACGASVAAAYGDISVTAYDSSDCTGTPAAPQQTFTGGPDVCQSYYANGVTYYGQAWCDEGNTPYFNACDDSGCTSCQSMSLVGADQCGNGFGVFTSMIATCGSSSISDSASTDTTAATTNTDYSGDNAISVSAYDSYDCSGTLAAQQTFTGGPDVCQTYSANGVTYYGQAWCDSNTPYFNACEDSGCTSCQSMSLVGADQCGNGFGVFASMIATCGSASSPAGYSNAYAAASANDARWTTAAGLGTVITAMSTLVALITL